ncbi:hypothetical protein [uncultured Legionella sp.]|uniref:hypothetical protein n=1 Tax=uncultured Legionella sp. TaxID=210934 RepID=UPI00260DD122|nr:hypothetical protein [uncultured Legionella sp.]
MPPNFYPEAIYYFEQLMSELISLKAEFKIERKAMRQLLPNDPENKYVTREQQAPYIARYIEEDALFTDGYDEVLDGTYNFVLTCEENPLLLCSEELHHSYLANGKKVLGVGTLFFEQGKLTIITNNSGHYRPTDNELLPAIKALYSVSKGTLIKYRSFCSSVVESYPVTELLDIDNFDTVRPLSWYEDILPASGKRIVTDYEQTIGCGSADARFGKVLSQELNCKYSKLLETGNAFFSNSLLSSDDAITKSDIDAEPMDEEVGINENLLING